MTKEIPMRVMLGLTAGVVAILVIVVMLSYSGSSSDTGLQGNPRTIIEHKYTSLLCDLGDDVISISPGESKTFSYALDDNRDRTGHMTGFVQVIPANMSGFSSVTVKIGNASVPTNYHQLHLSDGEIKQIDFVISNNGDVAFENTGQRPEQILFNLQLTYFASYRQ